MSYNQCHILRKPRCSFNIHVYTSSVSLQYGSRPKRSSPEGGGTEFAKFGNHLLSFGMTKGGREGQNLAFWSWRPFWTSPACARTHLRSSLSNCCITTLRDMSLWCPPWFVCLQDMPVKDGSFSHEKRDVLHVCSTYESESWSACLRVLSVLP